MRSDRPMGPDSNERVRVRRYQPVTAPRAPGRPEPGRVRDWVPGRVNRMIRHVVVFSWSESATADQRTRAVEALRRLPEDVGGMTAMTVAEDAGLTAGNADAVLIADFPD